MIEQSELDKQIPETAKEFRFANMFFKITRPEKSTVVWLVKNLEQPHEHYTFVVKSGKVSLHQTKEDNKKMPKQREWIDYERMMMKLGKMLERFFKDFQEIELTDPRFIGKKAVLLWGTRLLVEKADSKQVFFDQDIDYDEVLFENIDVAKNAVGTLMDDDDNEIGIMIIINNGSVYQMDLVEWESKNSDLLNKEIT